MNETLHISATKRASRLAGRLVWLAVALMPAFLLPSSQAPAQQYSRCEMLERELTSYDQVQPGNFAELERFNAAIRKQSSALQQTESRARQLGCYKTGFLFFQPRKPPQCRELTSSVERMQHNLDNLVARRDRISGPGSDSPGRQRLIRLLAENNCGNRYSREAGLTRSRGFFSNLFEEDEGPAGERPDFGAFPLPSGVATYRTLCVRTCDGYYFPISFATVPQRLEEDAESCRAQCPTAVVELYVHENPGGSMETAVSLGGTPYTSIPTAFKYRTEYVKGCSCNPYTLALENAEAKAAGEEPPGGQASGEGEGGENASAALGEGTGQPAGSGEIQSNELKPLDGEPGANTERTPEGVNIFRPNEQDPFPAPRFTTRDDGGPTPPNVIRIGPRTDEPELERDRSKEELPAYLDPLRTQ